MKKMKMVFGVLSILALSSFSFGANGLDPTNPGDSMEGVTTSQSAVTGVPLQIRVNVIPEGPELCLVDETGSLIESLDFDHGTKLKGTLTKSQVDKLVVLKRTDGKPFETDNGAKLNNFKVKFEATSPSFDETTHVFKLTKLNSGTGGAKEINTTLNYLDHEIKVKGTETAVKTLVTSIIPAGTVVEDGLYVGTGMFTATVTGIDG